MTKTKITTANNLRKSLFSKQRCTLIFPLYRATRSCILQAQLRSFFQRWHALWLFFLLKKTASQPRATS